MRPWKKEERGRVGEGEGQEWKRLKRQKKCPLFSALKNVIDRKEDRKNIYCGRNSILISYWGLLRNRNYKAVGFICCFLELRLLSIYSCCVVDALECVGYKEKQSRITESYILELDWNCKWPCTAGRPALSKLTSNCIEKHVGITIWFFKPQKKKKKKIVVSWWANTFKWRNHCPAWLKCPSVSRAIWLRSCTSELGWQQCNWKHRGDNVSPAAAMKSLPRQGSEWKESSLQRAFGPWVTHSHQPP